MKAVAQKGMYYIRQEGVSGIIARLKQQRSISVLQENLNLNTVPAASISYDNKTGYQLKPGRSGYCYVEPARPVDLAERIAAIESKPFFSIVIPVYNTPLDLLDGLLKSITSQWYPHWELILADDCSPDPQLQQALKIFHTRRLELSMQNLIYGFQVRLILVSKQQKGISSYLLTMTTSLRSTACMKWLCVSSSSNLISFTVMKISLPKTGTIPSRTSNPIGHLTP